MSWVILPTTEGCHFYVLVLNTPISYKNTDISENLWTKKENIGQYFLKGYFINKQPYQSFSKILWAAAYKGLDRTLYSISYEQSITYSSNIIESRTSTINHTPDYMTNY